MSRPSLLSALFILLLAMLGLAVVSTVTRAQRNSARTAGSARAAASALAAAPQPQQRPAPAAAPALPGRPLPPQPAPSFAVAEVPRGSTVKLRSRPGGRVVAAVASSTQFGSPSTLAVAARRGSWLGVTSTDLPNGRLGWVDSHSTRLRTHQTHISLRVDLSRRRLELMDGRRVLRRAAIGIGRPGSPTPTGRYAITDKLSGSAYGPYYGCCILALSGHQTNTPAGWQGGDRLAIHGTDNPATIGEASSAGCLHASTRDLEVLMRRVPLGTPVFIRR